MKVKKFILTLLTVLALSGLQAQVFTVVWETKPVFKTPESVYFDPAREQIYVSNINGKPLEKDGNGFISLLTKEGKIKELKWVTGLDAPKGMAVVDSLLYVTDIDRIRVIDINRAIILKTIRVDSAQFLNDLVADNNGNMYITDTEKNQILKLSNDTVRRWLTDEKIISPNGLAFNKNKLMVGTKEDLLSIDPVSKNIRVKFTGVGPIDGLVPVGGQKFVISNWSGRIMLVSPSEKIVLGNTTEQKIQAADLGYIPEQKLILIPTFYDNRVVARSLP
ncbi:MAG TPA: ATP/GTP-binding protein [Bacteroidetes bacterium]|nr:ATP/GTP-binding protein [Bacteroidota bacterium]